MKEDTQIIADEKLIDETATPKLAQQDVELTQQQQATDKQEAANIEELEDMDGLEFLLEEIENKIAPLALA
jgi:hypothetical protein